MASGVGATKRLLTRVRVAIANGSPSLGIKVPIELKLRFEERRHSKKLPIGERRRFQIRAEMFNLLNNVHLNQPGAT